MSGTAPSPWTSKSRAGLVGIFGGLVITLLVAGCLWVAMIGIYGTKVEKTDNAPADNSSKSTITSKAANASSSASAGAAPAKPADVPVTATDWFQASITGVWAGGACLLLGLLGLFIAWHLDKEHFRISQSIPLPLDQVRDGDFVWVNGQTTANEEYDAPEIHEKVVYYEYERSEKQGTSFKVVTDEKKTAAISIRTNGRAIRLDIDGDTDFAHLPEKSDSSSTVKWKLKYLPADGELNACGIVKVSGEGDDRELKLTAPDNMLDLQVTPVSREVWADRAEAEEIWAGTGAVTMIFLAALMFVAGFGPVYGLWGASVGALIGLIVGAGLVVLIGVTGTLARFGRHYQRVRSAWAEVANDFDQRRGLLNDLMAAAEKKAGHFSDDETAALANMADELHKAMEAAPPAEEKTDSTTEGKSRAARQEEADATVVRVDVEKVLSETLADLMSVVGKYLKTEDVIREMHRLENEVTYGRQHYNSVVGEYNQTISGFPRGLASWMLGFKQLPYWEGDDAALAAVLDPDKKTRKIEKSSPDVE